MGWRSAKASGNASMPVDEGGSFAQGFASTFVPMFSEATSSYLKEKQEERMLELKESLLRERASMSAARAASTSAQESAQEVAEAITDATSWLTFHGIPINEDNINGALMAADNVGGEGSARWSKLTTHYEGDPSAYTWSGGVQRNTPVEMSTDPAAAVSADTAIVYPDATPTGVETPPLPEPTIDDLEDTEVPSVFNNNLGQGLERTPTEGDPAETAVIDNPEDTEEDTGFASVEIDPGSIQFVAYTAPTADADPTAEPVINTGTGFGYKPSTDIPTAFKDAEVNVGSITSYTEWLAASQALRMSNSLMTAEQQGEWNEYGQTLFDVANSTELDFTGLDTLADVQGWEETYRSKMGAGPDAGLPESITQSLTRVRNVIEAETLNSMDEEQRMLRRYMDTDEFKKLNNLDQAMFIRNYDLLGKPNYETVEEARMALTLADRIGAGAGELSRIKTQVDQFEQQPGAFITKSGYQTVEVNGIPVLQPVQYYEKDGVLYDGTTNDRLAGNIKELDEAATKMWRSQSSGIQKYNNNVGAFIGLSVTLQDIIDVASVDDRSLTTVAGVLRNFDSFVTEAETFSSLLLNQPEERSYNRAQFEQEARAKGLLKEGETFDTLTSAEALQEAVAATQSSPEGSKERVKAVTRLRRMLDAKFAIAQFQIGAAEGQSSTAMSNKDREEFRRFLSGFKNVEDLATVYGTYMSNRLVTLQTQGQTYGPQSALGEQFRNETGAYPTAGAKPVREQIEGHPQADRLMFTFNNLLGGTFKESPNNPYREGAAPAPEPNLSTTDNGITSEAIMNMDQAALSEFTKTLKTPEGEYDFSKLSPEQFDALLNRLEDPTSTGGTQ